jgi:hypothetical protein
VASSTTCTAIIIFETLRPLFAIADKQRTNVTASEHLRKRGDSPAYSRRSEGANYHLRGRLPDPKTNAPYDTAFVRIDQSELAGMPNIRPYPGMAAIVLSATIH